MVRTKGEDCILYLLSHLYIIITLSTPHGGGDTTHNTYKI